jgi:hypothetical protein
MALSMASGRDDKMLEISASRSVTGNVVIFSSENNIVQTSTIDATKKKKHLKKATKM